MSSHAIWIAAAFVMTALWAAVVIVNKRVLEYVEPVPVNFFVRICAMGGLLAITVPLTTLDLWSNGFGIDRASAGWIALSALATWLVAFNAYYYALRGERVAVVAPICSTDPLWTALFSWAILGAALGGFTLAGMAIAMTGVLLISRWMEESDEDVALAGAAYGDVLPAEGVSDPPARGAAEAVAVRAASSEQARAARLRVVGLAVLAAAGWGLGPVFITLAANAYGKVTATMMIESQLVGLVTLAPLLILRRTPLTTRRLSSRDRGRAVGLLILGGLLEASVSVLYYLCIAAIGPVLTMLIMATTPVFTIIIGFVALGERPGRRLTLAAIVTVAGVLVATLEGFR